MSVLVYVENTQGQFKKSTFEVVSYAKAIADTLSTNLVALSIGEVSAEQLDSLSKYGAAKILNAADSQLKAFDSQLYAAVIAEAAQKEAASVVVMANSFSVKGLSPRVAVKLKAGLVSGAVDLPQVNGDQLIVKKTAYSGKAFAMVSLSSPVKIIALNANSYQVKENATSASVENFQASLPASKIKVKEVVRATDKISLPDAELVVSAGRGMKGPENWHLVEDLANALGAATACSKPVSDAGWRPHEEHVGQTGIAVSPNLYIAVGISGAIQHLAGISSSKTIVAINKDPEAPFFKVADYGMVGDAMEILPKLTEAVKAYKNQG